MNTKGKLSAFPEHISFNRNIICAILIPERREQNKRAINEIIDCSNLFQGFPPVVVVARAIDFSRQF